MKKPPDRKLLLVAGLLIVAASVVFARPVDYARPINLIVLGGR